MSSQEPHATISAQQLTISQPDHCGFLRKRGQKERVLENLHLSKRFNWRQRFVAVKDGCCYCFVDEVAKTPLQTFSLQGYNRVYRTTSDRAAFVFAVEPAGALGGKLHIFAASSDDDRRFIYFLLLCARAGKLTEQLWMRVFRNAMVVANSCSSSWSGGSLAEDEDIYTKLEKPVFESQPPGTDIGREFTGEGGFNDNDDEDSDDSDYDKPDEDWRCSVKTKPERHNLPLPPVPTLTPTKNKTPGPAPQPKSNHSNPVPANSRKREPALIAKVKPIPAEKPRRRLSERDCLFDNSDREAALSLLRDKKETGTFLIRKSRQGDSKVLAVMTEEGVKEYKIFTEDKQVSLDKKTSFDSVDDLLEYYSKNLLPNRHQTLGRSYSSLLP